MNLPNSLAVVGWSLFAAGALSAQTPQLQQQLPPPAQSPAATTAEETTLDPAALAPDELGEEILLARRPRPRWLRVSSETQYAYTSNLLLLDGDNFPPSSGLTELEDSFLFQSFDVAITPPLSDQVTTTIYGRYDIIRYDRHSEFDFDANTAGLNVSLPVEDWFTVYADFSGVRQYLTDGPINEFFRMWDTRGGVWRSDQICPHASIFYGYQFDWRAASPAILSRVDNAVYAGLKSQFLKRCTAQLLYRLSVQESLEINRTDVNQLVSLAVHCAFTDRAVLTAFADYSHNNSDIATRDYEVFDLGGGLNLTVRF